MAAQTISSSRIASPRTQRHRGNVAQQIVASTKMRGTRNVTKKSRPIFAERIHGSYIVRDVVRNGNMPQRQQDTSPGRHSPVQRSEPMPPS
jgi:hypothetical protein